MHFVRQIQSDYNYYYYDYYHYNDYYTNSQDCNL